MQITKLQPPDVLDCSSSTPEERKEPGNANAKDPVGVPPPLLDQFSKFSRPIPPLRNTHALGAWNNGVAPSVGVTSTTSVDVNEETGETSDTFPRTAPTVGSFHIDSDFARLEVFAPVNAVSELGKALVTEAHLADWLELEPYWTSTVAVYEHSLSALKHQLKKTRAEAAMACDKAAFAQKRAEVMGIRKSHIKRDWAQNHGTLGFPNGEAIYAEYKAAFLNFEDFACDATNCFEDAGEVDPTSVFVHSVMHPLCTVTEKYVLDKLQEKRALLREQFNVDIQTDMVDEESVSHMFWYQTQQAQVPAEIKNLTDVDIDQIISTMDEKVSTLHQVMVEEGAQHIIDYSEQNLRIPQLVRLFLRLHTITILSDPRCYLHPLPGQIVNYTVPAHGEILSPGNKRYGRIQEGDKVVVVLPGLYFENPTDNPQPIWPICPALVRRLIK